MGNRTQTKLQKKNPTHIRVLDIGGTKIRAGTVNVKTEAVTDIIKVPTPKQKKKLEEVFSNLIKGYNQYVFCIPGIFNEHKITMTGNLHVIEGSWVLQEFKPLLINDADAFALGTSQTFHNTLQQQNDIHVGIIYGTDIGCGILLNNQLLKNAGEITKIVYKNNKSYHDLIRGKIVAQKLGITKKQAPKIIAKAKKELAQGFAHMLCTAIRAYNPNTITLGGAVAKFSGLSPLAMKQAREIVAKEGYHPKITVDKKPLAPLIGGARYYIQQLKKRDK